MSRVFTTKFFFDQRLYDAIVTIVIRDGIPNFTIKLLDPDLHEIVAGGELTYEGKNGYKKLDLMQDKITRDIVRSIATAIEEHLGFVEATDQTFQIKVGSR